MGGRTAQYSTLGNLKAKGLEVTFDYPQSWLSESGKRPNILTLITSERGRGLQSCGLEIRNIPKLADLIVSDKEVADELFDPSGLSDFMPSGSTYISGSRTSIDGQPAAWIKFIQDMDRAGMKIRMAWVFYPIYFDKKLIYFNCAVGGSAEEAKEDLLKRLQVNLPLFQQMASTIIIHDKWKSKSR